MTLKYEIGVLEQELLERAEEAGKEIASTVNTPLTEAHAEVARKVQAAASALLDLRETFGGLKDTRPHVLQIRGEQVEVPVDHTTVRTWGLLISAKRLLEDLQAKGYDVDEGLLNRLS